MTDGLSSRLSSMHAEGKILGHISVQTDANTLRAGWIEEGIVSKSIDGSIDEKENQRQYVIPLSSTVRHLVDRGLNTAGDAGIVILGEQGLDNDKFVLVFRVESDEGNIFRYVSAFWIRKYNPHEILRLFLKYELGQELSGTFSEPAIDYVEYLREQVSMNRCPEVFSLRIPENWKTSHAWINDILKARSNETTLLRHNPTNRSIPLGLLMSNWISEINTTLKIKNPVAACLFQRTSGLESFFWDGPGKIATVAIFEDSDVESLSMNLILPLWVTSKEPIYPPSKTKEGIAREETDSLVPSEAISSKMKELPPEYKIILSKAEDLMESVDVDDTFRRIERIEGVVGELEHMSTKEIKKPSSTRANQMESQLRKALDRLDQLVSSLDELEERIESACKQME
ncbi:MAG: hypothetical protein P1Q69_01290 [Candidatus Thorarchaeota archaeon]|nr:hypothetical protein [Candidatus Thorarchaeota archaeon]